MPIQTVFLDAGGVLVHPNWTRVSDTLRRHGVEVSAATLAAAEPHAKRRLDTGDTIAVTTDQQRGWTHFNLVLTEAGVPLSEATAAALAELHAYHQTYNLWETVPDEVRSSTSRLATPNATACACDRWPISSHRWRSVAAPFRAAAESRSAALEGCQSERSSAAFQGCRRIA